MAKQQKGLNTLLVLGIAALVCVCTLAVFLNSNGNAEDVSKVGIDTADVKQPQKAKPEPTPAPMPIAGPEVPQDLIDKINAAVTLNDENNFETNVSQAQQLAKELKKHKTSQKTVAYLKNKLVDYMDYCYFETLMNSANPNKVADIVKEIKEHQFITDVVSPAAKAHLKNLKK